MANAFTTRLSCSRPLVDEVRHAVEGAMTRCREGTARNVAAKPAADDLADLLVPEAVATGKRGPVAQDDQQLRRDSGVSGDRETRECTARLG